MAAVLGGNNQMNNRGNVSNPSNYFLNWLATNPILSDNDKHLIDMFYKYKLTGHQLENIRKYQRYIYRYNEYKKSIINNPDEWVFLDEFFVDETCVWFLMYHSYDNMITTREIMLES